MKRILIALTRVYQKTLSKILPSSCRFYPSCSQYAIEALEMHGAFRGSVLACWRILRCNPFGSCGEDPVPKRFWGHDAVSKEQDEL